MDLDEHFHGSLSDIPALVLFYFSPSLTHLPEESFCSTLSLCRSAWELPGLSPTYKYPGRVFKMLASFWPSAFPADTSPSFPGVLTLRMSASAPNTRYLYAPVPLYTRSGIPVSLLSINTTSISSYSFKYFVYLDFNPRKNRLILSTWWNELQHGELIGPLAMISRKKGGSISK